MPQTKEYNIKTLLYNYTNWFTNIV